MEYSTIKQTAKAMGCRASDLIVLAAANDPFYIGQPAQVMPVTVLGRASDLIVLAAANDLPDDRERQRYDIPLEP
jgi:hypothetical protein